jgi:predicted RNA methylase
LKLVLVWRIIDTMNDTLKAFYKLFSLTEQDIGQEKSALKLIGTFDSPLMRKVANPNISDEDAINALNSSPNHALANYLVLMGEDMVSLSDFFETYRDLMGNDVAELGCGAGVFSTYLASAHPNMTVTGIDRQKTSIKSAEQIKKRVGCDNCSFLCAQIGVTPLSHIYSGVVGLNYLWNQIVAEYPYGRQDEERIFNVMLQKSNDVFAPVAQMLPDMGWYLGFEIIPSNTFTGMMLNGAFSSDLMPIHCIHGKLNIGDVDTSHGYAFLLQKNLNQTFASKRKFAEMVSDRLSQDIDW